MKPQMDADSKLHDVAAELGLGVVAPEKGNNSINRIFKINIDL